MNRTRLSNGIVINLAGLWSWCEKCEGLKPAHAVGMRLMANGEVRTQPYCKKCRRTKKRSFVRSWK